MTFSDIMALAKNGYKPGDIKELMALQTEPEQSGAIESEPEQSGANLSEPEQTEQTEQSGETSKNDEMEALKKQVAELTKKLSDTQSELKTAQKANAQSNIKKDGGQSDTERLNDWARSFM
jgi:DNA-binding transcriptional MerR regulator